MSLPDAEIRCDLIVWVRDALRPTRDCLASLRRHAPAWARVVVVADGSDERTTEWLREREGIVLLENETEAGFARSANRALGVSKAPYVGLLTSDALLTAGAVERMVARMEDDGRVGICRPLSDDSGPQSVRLPAGEDVFSFARRVARSPAAAAPDAVAAPASFLLVRRELLDRVGLLDERLGRGLGELAELHERARKGGWRCVVADDTFVGHQAGAGPAERDRRAPRGRDWSGAGTPEPFDVLFVLPMMGVYGGVADVLELANALVMEGRHAGVVLLEDVERELDLPLLFRPLRIPSSRLLDDLPEARLLVATSYQTAVPVAVAALRRPWMQTAYFVQDYEGWFGGDPPEVVSQTYDLIPRMTAISTWLAGELAARHSHVATVVPMSADPEVFYPRSRRTDDGPLKVVAMLRPDERRGARYLLPALAEVSRQPGIEVVLFGSHEVPKDADSFPHHHAGVLSREGVARLLSEAAIVVDPSLFQGFGLVGLEGMACGAACVLTDSGGIREYAVDSENALIVPPRDERALAEAILRLAADAGLRKRLGEAGIATARRFTWQRAAQAFLGFVDSLPPAAPPVPSTRAALELLWRERQTGAPAPSNGNLEAELHQLRQTLAAITRSTVWRLFTPYWKLKAKLAGR